MGSHTTRMRFVANLSLWVESGRLLSKWALPQPNGSSHTNTTAAGNHLPLLPKLFRAASIRLKGKSPWLHWEITYFRTTISKTEVFLTDPSIASFPIRRSRSSADLNENSEESESPSRAIQVGFRGLKIAPPPPPLIIATHTPQTRTPHTKILYLRAKFV